MIGAFSSQKLILYPQFLDNGDFTGYLIYKKRPESLIQIFGIWKRATNKVKEFVFFHDEMTDFVGATNGTLYSGVHLENIGQISLKGFVINDDFTMTEDVLKVANISKANTLISK